MKAKRKTPTKSKKPYSTAPGDPVQVDRTAAGDPRIVTVILNRPEKLNAISSALWAQLGEAMRALNAEDDIGCIVLRGAGDRAFGPGADISEFETTRKTTRMAVAYGKVMHATLAAIDGCRHPTVALIHGLCVGGSLEIAAMCDMRIAGESARFGVPINRIGVIMAYPELTALIDLVGRATALEILLEARVFGAAEAKDKGLVTRVVPDAKVEEDAYLAAGRIASGAPLSNRWHKKFARRLRSPKPLSKAEYLEGFANCDTRDYLEGYRA
ncbi:MAG: enoyl-CoA hydratase/isomerase family protein, partial [Rhodospirillales bacterium]|nr:enoyl-CoA hydratase/isomerase family protein [Rhodospirillales bacterium]